MAATKQKRSADEAGVSESPTGRPSRSKAPKTDDGTAKEKKGGITAALSTSEFKSAALPLHVNITHTPPVLTEDDSSVPATLADPGYIASSTLLATTFSTGSYGWKGNKRVTMELENPETGEKEKVQVMISINATVMGSKKAAKDDAEESTKEGTDTNKDSEGEDSEI